MPRIRPSKQQAETKPEAKPNHALAEIATTTDDDKLPSLLTHASQRLLDARTSAEVLEAKDIAEAAFHLAKVVGAAKETQADCLRIITRAEMRMADEIDAGQASGEVARRGGDRANVRGPDNGNEATLDELGVPRQRLSEWREVRDAGEDVVEDAIQGALDEGRAPTKADIRHHVRAKPKRAGINTGNKRSIKPPRRWLEEENEHLERRIADLKKTVIFPQKNGQG